MNIDFVPLNTSEREGLRRAETDELLQQKLSFEGKLFWTCTAEHAEIPLCLLITASFVILSLSLKQVTQTSLSLNLKGRGNYETS